jgi:hypothetical protein
MSLSDEMITRLAHSAYAHRYGREHVVVVKPTDAQFARLHTQLHKTICTRALATCTSVHRSGTTYLSMDGQSAVSNVRMTAVSALSSPAIGPRLSPITTCPGVIERLPN